MSTTERIARLKEQAFKEGETARAIMFQQAEIIRMIQQGRELNARERRVA